MTDIHTACRDGDLDQVKQLVAQNAELVDADDEHEWRPIFHAALRQHIDVVRFLISAGADLAAHDGYVMHYAGEIPNNKPIVELLVRYGALDAHVKPMNELSRQLLAAVFLADEVRVRSLLTRHPQLATMRDGAGDFPIHHAARNGDTQIVQALLDHGADVNAMADKQHTVLYCAAGHGHVETVELLLRSGADLYAQFSKQRVTLHQWLTPYVKHQPYARIAELLERYAD